MEKPLHSWYGAACFILLTALLAAQTLWFVCNSELIPSTEPRTGYFMFLDHRGCSALWSCGVTVLAHLVWSPGSLCLESFPWTLFVCLISVCAVSKYTFLHCFPCFSFY